MNIKIDAISAPKEWVIDAGSHTKYHTDAIKIPFGRASRVIYSASMNLKTDDIATKMQSLRSVDLGMSRLNRKVQFHITGIGIDQHCTSWEQTESTLKQLKQHALQVPPATSVSGITGIDL